MNKPKDMKDQFNQPLYKINLHSHTRYSDGANTIKEMALTSKNLGFCCHVITDHYYGRDDLAPYSLTKETFLEAIKEAEEVSREINFPIIVGAECGYNNMEEINVFGKEAILYLMDHGVSHDDYLRARANTWCAMQLNHPAVTNSLKSKVWEVIDCFERFNSGQDFFKGEYGDKDRRKIPIELKGIRQTSNSDAHQFKSLDRGYNLIDEKIESEGHLINYLRSSKKPIAWSANGSLKTYMESHNKDNEEVKFF